MSPLVDMWMPRRKKQKRDRKGPLLKELNQRKYGFLNFLLNKCIPKHLMKNKKLYGFPSLFWRTWILKTNQSWHLSFQRLPLHLLPNIFLKRFQNLLLHLPLKWLYYLICLSLNLFHPWFPHHSITLQGVCQCWSCLISHPPSWNPLNLTPTFYPHSFQSSKTKNLILHLPLIFPAFPFHYLINIFERTLLWPWIIMTYIIGVLSNLRKLELFLKIPKKMKKHKKKIKRRKNLKKWKMKKCLGENHFLWHLG